MEHRLVVLSTSPFATRSRKKTFENIVGKEENAGYQHSLFPSMFYTLCTCYQFVPV